MVVFENGVLPVPPTSTAWPPLTPRLWLPEADVKSTIKPAPAPLKSPWTSVPEWTRLPLLNKTLSVFWLPGLPVVIVIGSAQAVDDASAMMAKAAEASITRWNIWGIFRGLLSLIQLAREGKVLIGRAFQRATKRHKSTKWVSESLLVLFVPFCGYSP